MTSSDVAIKAAAGVLRTLVAVSRQERLHLLSQFTIVGARLFDERRPFIRSTRERGAQNRLDIVPALAHHLERTRVRDAFPSSSRDSHILATRQSRLTVSTDIPSTSAVSSTLKPPKNRSSTT